MNVKEILEGMAARAFSVSFLDGVCELYDARDNGSTEADYETGMAQLAGILNDDQLAFCLVPEEPGVHYHKGNHGQDDKQHLLHDALVHCHGEVGTQGAAENGKDNGGQGDFPVHKTLTDEADGGEGGAAGGRELVGGDGVVHGQTRQQIGGQGNQSAAAADGVHQARQEQHGTDDEKGLKR